MENKLAQLKEYIENAMKTYNSTIKVEIVDEDIIIEHMFAVCWEEGVNWDGLGKNSGWMYMHIKHFPGVMYYPDGSGEPPSDDFIEKGFYFDKDKNELLERILDDLHNFMKEIVFENLSYEEIHKEETGTILDDD
jgi:hypothetical protein